MPPIPLHSKVVVVDDDFVTTGSTNFDFRSFEHNFEGNVLVYSNDFNQRMKDVMLMDMQQCSRMESIVRLFGPLL